jgi:ribonuclease VapC
MVLETSAIIAILLGESERDHFIDAIADDPVRLISAVSALEAALVIEARKGEAGGREFDLLLHNARIEIVPFTQEHIDEARTAWRTYGKGNHPAGLNFCDCCAYALSKVSRETLLFKGRDFPQTDVISALKKTVEPPTRLLTIKLHKAFYRQGFFNVGVEHERYFGPHNTAVEIYVENTKLPIAGRISRTAQRNGTPRIMGHSGLRKYFQSRFHEGDLVDVTIETPERIRIQPHRSDVLAEIRRP